MAGEWEKVARWAGIGNNNKESSASKESSTGDGSEMMEDTMVHGAEEKDLAFDGSLTDGPEPTGGSQAAGPEGSPEAASLKAELQQARGERDQLLDRLARLQAEFENSRRREAKERQDMRDYAVQSAVEPFLGVMDNFQLALKSDGTLEQLRSGVQLILKQMEEALRGLSVQPVETVGAQFDPRIHEALGSIETTEFPDHQVLEEIRRGYKLREKLLRPALVRIASNSAQVSE
jgi:molecular chaperone GrpE